MDVSKLIEAVEAHPAIWDKDSELYKIKAERDRSWMTVGEIVVDNWSELNDNERESEINLLKGKWKNLKDYYSKYQKDKLIDPTPKRRKYWYEDKLHFLQNIVGKRESSGCIPDAGNSYSRDRLSLPSVRTYDRRQPSNQNVPATATSADAFLSANTIFFEDASSGALAEEGQDSDRLYIMSLLEDYRSLPKPRKWEFQRMVADFFSSVEDYPPASTSYNVTVPSTVRGGPYHQHLHFSFGPPSKPQTSHQGQNQSDQDPLDESIPRGPLTVNIKQENNN